MGGSGRRRRWIHRRGALFEATLHAPAAAPGSGASRQDRRALVRMSCTFGWPRPLPDWTGMGIRLFGAEAGNGNGNGHLDMLLVSSAPVPQLWCQMRPSRDVLACSLSSVVRYPLGGVEQIVVAVPIATRSATLDELQAQDPAAVCPIRYRLDVARDRGAWRELGELVLTRKISDDREVRFRPPETGPRRFTAFRRVVYRLAQG